MMVMMKCRSLAKFQVTFRTSAISIILDLPRYILADCFVKCKCEPAIMDFDAKPINNSALNLSWSINLTDKSPISIKQLTLTKLP